MRTTESKKTKLKPVTRVGSSTLVMRLRRRIQTLTDENAKLEYYSALTNQWASGHCAERMADWERHIKQLRQLIKMRKFSNKRFYAYVRRQAKNLGKRKPHNNGAMPRRQTERKYE
jgi:hypothetical protein